MLRDMEKEQGVTFSKLHFEDEFLLQASHAVSSAGINIYIYVHIYGVS